MHQIYLVLIKAGDVANNNLSTSFLSFSYENIIQFACTAAAVFLVNEID